MQHPLELINHDKKGDKAKIRTQEYIKLNTGAKEIQQVNPGGPDNSQSIINLFISDWIYCVCSVNT